jgi:DNA-directed RNA polymerase beta' subunit
VIPAAVHQRLPAALLQGLALRSVTGEDIRARSSGAITRPVWAASDPELRRGGLFDPEIFGRGWEDPTPNAQRERVDGSVDTFVAHVSTNFGHIELAVPVTNPLTGDTLDAIAVLPPSLRPLIYLQNARYSASNLNDLYQQVIEISARLRRLREMDPDSGAKHGVDLARAVEQLFVNGTAHPARTPTGRQMTSIADHLRIAGRSGVKSLLWSLGFDASWSQT